MYLSAVATIGEDGRRLYYDVGPFYAERLPDYHSLDVRFSRRSRRGRGELTFFLDIQNLLDHDNLRVLDIDRYGIDWSGTVGTVHFEEMKWLGVLPFSGSQLAVLNSLFV